MEKKVLFKNIDYFESNCDLFINFAFFQFINLLGSPFLDKISKNIYKYSDNYNSFFNSLKVKCDFEEIITNDRQEGYLKLLFSNTNIDNNDFNTYIYSNLIIQGKRIELNGKEDRYDPITSKIKLSIKTLNKIHKKVKIGRKCSGCEICFDDKGIRNDPILNSLIDLYLNNKYDNQIDFKEKINTFVAKVTSPPRNAINNDGRLFEIDKNGNNRIRYENLQKGEIYFFQGPPGTGKTYTIKRLIEENDFVNKFDKIIVSSYVHVAINNIVEHMLGKVIPNDKYASFYDLYQYMTVLYSNRALSKIEDSPASELIELDKIIEEEQYSKAEKIYTLRKDKSKELVNDFDEKIENLNQGNFKDNINSSVEDKINKISGEKFKRIFSILSNSGEEYINYEKAFELIKELSDKYNENFVHGKDIDWCISNYSNAVKNYSNIIFCTLNNLQRELDRQKKSDNILVIIDEASKSTIINYLLLLNNIENITLLVLGDPEQLNESLVFSNNINNYSKIMTAFTFSDLKDTFMKDNYSKYIVDDMKRILFELVKNKDNRANDSKVQQVGYEKYENVDVKMWKEILSETFYETLFNSASEKRKELLNIHRRSRSEIFNLSKFLYSDSYVMGDKKIDNDLLIPNYDVLTRIVVDNKENSTTIINQIIDKWNNHQNKIDKKMNMGVITFYNDYKKRFEKEINNDNISLYTIDSSQGEEFTTVIIYLDLSPINRKITEFIKDYHRINVAVSRAREQLIIVETREFVDEYNKIKDSQIDYKFKRFIDNIHSIPERGDSNE